MRLMSSSRFLEFGRIATVRKGSLSSSIFAEDLESCSGHVGGRCITTFLAFFICILPGGNDGLYMPEATLHIRDGGLGVDRRIDRRQKSIVLCGIPGRIKILLNDPEDELDWVKFWAIGRCKEKRVS